MEQTCGIGCFVPEADRIQDEIEPFGARTGNTSTAAAQVLTLATKLGQNAATLTAAVDIHVFSAARKTWMPSTRAWRPGMTETDSA